MSRGPRPDWFGKQPATDSAVFTGERVESAYAYGHGTPITMAGLAWLVVYHAKVASGAGNGEATNFANLHADSVLDGLWARS